MKRGTLARLALLSRRFDPWLKAETPLVTMEYRGSPETKNLIIFLPGIGDVAEDFERQGFIRDMRRHGVTADAIAVDAHYGYYASRAIHARITDDLITAARSAGYEKIWLAGISLGGFGAATYAALHPSHVDGLLLFAPYLGDSALVREIAGAGGVSAWQPGTVAEADVQRSLWAWLKSGLSGSGATFPASFPRASFPIYLGYGKSDMFEQAHGLLAELLPENRVYSIPGGHDWRTWKQLWQTMLPDWAVCHAEMPDLQVSDSFSPVNGSMAL